ncbi:MAG: hypothetical protein WC222_08915 [Parachlamydiales bacterium]|jgi:hypothetical protein
MFRLNGNSNQISWVGGSVVGHSIDKYTNEIDLTEGFGAFDSIFNLSYALSGRALDIGGGASDANCAYVAQRYLLDSVVYDPYMRDPTHNQKVLAVAKKRPFDIAFSLSILNVINDEESRKNHIRLCLSTLKPSGKAIFKVWSGDNSGIGKLTQSGYQSNLDIEKYFDEIAAVFGKDRVKFDEQQKAFICFNNRDTYPSGSVFLV